jgi:O-methyltransferase
MSLKSYLAVWSARMAVRLHPHLRLRGQEIDYAFAEDGMATLHDCSFLKDARFQRAYELGKATGSWYDCDLRWRIHVLLWAASRAAQLPGAFVECGVNRGGFARSIIDYVDFASLGREYFLFDTYAGFDEAQLSDAERAHMMPAYRYGDCYAEVQSTFASMPFVRLVRGAVPGSLIDTGPVAFLSLDMNCAAPEIAAARFFWPRLVSGAPIILDDYGFALHSEQKQAFDALALEWQVPILSLPTGQAMIMKP